MYFRFFLPEPWVSRGGAETRSEVNSGWLGIIRTHFGLGRNRVGITKDSLGVRCGSKADSADSPESLVFLLGESGDSGDRGWNYLTTEARRA
jgi:hypothetical protein